MKGDELGVIGELAKDGVMPETVATKAKGSPETGSGGAEDGSRETSLRWNSHSGRTGGQI